MNTEEMQKQIESMMPTPEQIVEHLDRKIEEAKRLYKTANSDQKYVLESLFPQLKETEDDRMRKNIKVALISMEDNLADFYSTHRTSQKELIAWLEKQCDKDKLIQELGEYKVKYTQEVLEKHIKSMDNKEDEMIKKSLINYVYCHGDAGDFTKKELIAWLEKQGEQKPVSNVEPKFKVKYAGSEYNVFETKDIAGVTFYGIEDEPNHIDYVKAENCEVISGYSIKENGSPYPTKLAVFSEQKPAWSEEDEENLNNVLYILNQLKDTSSYEEDNTAEKTINWFKSLKYRLCSK